MVHLNMNQPVPGRVEPGTYLAKIKNVEVKKSSAGDNMIAVDLVLASDGSQICRDHIMLGGAGWGIGKDKLTALGVDPSFQGDFNARDLVGRRVWVAVTSRTYTDRKGVERTALNVDVDQLKFKGMQAESDVPAGCIAPEPEQPYADEGTPF